MELETSRMEEAEEIRERYELSMERIRAMKEETAVSAPFMIIFRKPRILFWKQTGWRRTSGKDVRPE